MAELKCPHCGQAFTVDDTELSSIVSQIRDKEFEKDLSQRTSELERHLKERHELELSAKENEIILRTSKQYEQEKEDHAKEVENLKLAQAKELYRAYQEEKGEEKQNRALGRSHLRELRHQFRGYDCPLRW